MKKLLEVFLVIIQVLFGIAMILLGLAQLFAGYVGIKHYLGSILAFVIIGLSAGLRFTLPITIGAFLGAMNVWNWHWSLAGIFAAPGLLFMLPGIFAIIVSSIKKK